jgi:hypothetical protein
MKTDKTRMTKEEFKEWLDRLSLNPNSLAREMGVSPSGAYRWAERGVPPTSSPRVRKFLDKVEHTKEVQKREARDRVQEQRAREQKKAVTLATRKTRHQATAPVLDPIAPGAEEAELHSVAVTAQSVATNMEEVVDSLQAVTDTVTTRRRGFSSASTAPTLPPTSVGAILRAVTRLFAPDVKDHVQVLLKALSEGQITIGDLPF